MFEDMDWLKDISLSSALTSPGLLLDSLEDSKHHQLIKNDVVLSEGLTDQISRIEHSYSYSIASDGDSIPSSPLSLDLQDDMEQECFPCIPMKKANQQDLSFVKKEDDLLCIKRESFSPPVPHTNPSILTNSSPACTPPLPAITVSSTTGTGCSVGGGGGGGGGKPMFTKPTLVRKYIKQDPDGIHVQVKSEPLGIVQTVQTTTVKQNPHSLLKPTVPTGSAARIICPKVSVKIEDTTGNMLGGGNPGLVTGILTTSGDALPVATITTSGSIYSQQQQQRNNTNNTNSISKATANNSLQRVTSLQQQQQLSLASAVAQTTTATTTRQRILPAVRQTINSPLISTQLKGSSGMICLTEEEKRTLISEGYPIPTKLPLSKAEERSLKKIRRKIKNKISAQESRRKKKEYMDALERKYDLMQNEASLWRTKADELEAKNAQLIQQIAALQDKLTVKSSSTAALNLDDSAAFSMLPTTVHAVRLATAPGGDLQDKCGGGEDLPGVATHCLDIDVD